MRLWRYSSAILYLGTRRRWVVSFTPRPLCPRYPLDRRLSGPQSWSGRCGVDTKSPVPRRETNPGRPANSPSLYQLSYPGSLEDMKIFKKWTEVNQDKVHWRTTVNTGMHLRVPWTSQEGPFSMDYVCTRACIGVCMHVFWVPCLHGGICD
jgi:hypothetical protein